MTGPHSTSPSFTLTVVPSCVFHIKGNFGLLCLFSLAPWACEKAGGHGAEAQKKDGVLKSWEDPGWQAVFPEQTHELWQQSAVHILPLHPLVGSW